MVGNNVSHSKRRTKRKFDVNLFTKKFYWVEQDCWVSLNISAAGLRTINKLGLDAAIKKAAEKRLFKRLIWRRIRNGKESKGNRVQVIMECTEHKRKWYAWHIQIHHY